MEWIIKFYRHQNGASAIEFSLTAVIFFSMIFFIAEITRIAYLSAVLDLAISEAAKQAKNTPSQSQNSYQTLFDGTLINSGGNLWHFLAKKDAVTSSIMYAENIEQLINKKGSTSDSTNKPLALYRVTYRYVPMFFPFSTQWVERNLSREVIFVQEYERSKFMH